jgi:HEXXH motif-containing protein
VLQDLVNEFLDNPFPLWDTRLTRELVSNRLDNLVVTNICQTIAGYNTINSYFKDNFDYHVVKYQLNIPSEEPVFLEQPSLGYLHAFYNDHGLETLPTGHLSTEDAISKLGKAFKVMTNIPGCFNCVTNLVKCIQILKTNDAEIDVSYSHPEIPFSIFISVCDEESFASDLRVCESILHEAMHLKLTLIEEQTPIVKANSEETFFSPWRDEQRPLRGVLHGLFVFRAILEFYKCLRDQDKRLYDELNLSLRIFEISYEIQELAKLSQCKDLTIAGQKLAVRLTQSLNL